MITLSDATWDALIKARDDSGVLLEGKLLKIIDKRGLSEERAAYLEEAVAAGKLKEKQRLDISKKFQKERIALVAAEEENEALLKELRDALEEARQERIAADEARAEAESAKELVEADLEFMMQRTQFELMGRIVQVSLVVILGVGVITTVLYASALFGFSRDPADTALLANTWSNMFGILLTNSFSIIGTIMGVKYATEKQGE